MSVKKYLLMIIWVILIIYWMFGAIYLFVTGNMLHMLIGLIGVDIVWIPIYHNKRNEKKTVGQIKER